MSKNDPELNFFWPFSRFWELSVGSALAVYELKYGRVKNRVLEQALPLIGFFLIAYSIYTFDSNTPHPGMFTTIPVFGVALIIFFSTGTDVTGRILSLKPMVGLGLISYSLYLWHFPIFAFNRIISSNHSNSENSEWILLSLFLSIFSYSIIEKPFRRRACVFGAGVNGVIALKIITLVVILSFLGFRFPTGIWERFAPNSLVMTDTILKTEDDWSFRNDGLCTLNFTVENNKGATQDINEWMRKLKTCLQDVEPVVIAVGDSHAKNIFDAVAYSDGVSRIFGLTNGGCRAHECKINFNFLEYFFQHVGSLLRSQDLVIYHQAGGYFVKDSEEKYHSSRLYIEGEKYSISYSDRNAFAVRDYLNNISDLSKAKVIWLGPFWDNGVDKKKVINKLKTGSYDSFDFDITVSIRKYYYELDKMLVEVSRGQKYVFMPFYEFHRQDPTGFVRLADGTRCFQFRDDDHFSNCGELFIAENLEAWQEKIWFEGRELESDN